MKQIRRGVFETNSSSTHSITICMKDEYDRWRSGKLLLDGETGFVTVEQAIQMLREDRWYKGPDPATLSEDQLFETLANNEFYTWDTYGNKYLEFYSDEYTTPSGETVVAFGEYGFDC